MITFKVIDLRNHSFHHSGQCDNKPSVLEGCPEENLFPVSVRNTAEMKVILRLYFISY